MHDRVQLLIGLFKCLREDLDDVVDALAGESGVELAQHVSLVRRAVHKLVRLDPVVCLDMVLASTVAGETVQGSRVSGGSVLLDGECQSHLLERGLCAGTVC